MIPIPSLRTDDKIVSDSPCCQDAQLLYSELCHAPYCSKCNTWQGEPWVQPVTFGPTWRRGEDGKFARPEHTLGPQIVRWVKKYVRSPDGDGNWQFTPEQLRLLYWIYAVEPKSNNHRTVWKYREITIQRLKGWGLARTLSPLCSPSSRWWARAA